MRGKWYANTNASHPFGTPEPIFDGKTIGNICHLVTCSHFLCSNAHSGESVRGKTYAKGPFPSERIRNACRESIGTSPKKFSGSNRCHARGRNPHITRRKIIVENCLTHSQMPCGSGCPQWIIVEISQSPGECTLGEDEQKKYC